MNPRALLAMMLAGFPFLPTPSARASGAVGEVEADDEYWDLDETADGECAPSGTAGDDEYWDLEGMADEDLEEICASRGFELVREVDAETGEPLEYTHQDYVEAAAECLQIEADLEEILQKNPEILEDVRRESERMMRKRDRLLEQLRRQNETTEGAEPNDAPANTNGDAEEREGGEAPAESNDGPAVTRPNAAPTETAEEGEGDKAPAEPNDRPLNYDFREITLEVIEQMKSDFATVVNLILPAKRRERIQRLIQRHVRPALKSFSLVAKDAATTAYEMARPAFKSFSLVARDMATTACGMARRYLVAFVNGNSGGERDASPAGDDSLTGEKEEFAL